MLRALARLRLDLGSSRKGILAQAFGILSSALHGVRKVRVAGSAAAREVDGTRSKFWLLSADARCGQLASRAEGLDQAEAERRLTVLGRNVLASGHRPGLGKRIWRRIAEPLVAILAVAAILSIFFGDAASAAIILVVLILSITLDLAQEHKAERAVDRLRQSVAIMVDVLRSGQLAQVACEAIVPGECRVESKSTRTGRRLGRPPRVRQPSALTPGGASECWALSSAETSWRGSARRVSP